MFYYLLHSVCEIIRSLKPTRPPDWRRALVLFLPVAGLMAVFLSNLLPGELAAIANGEITGETWWFWTFLAIFAIILGLGTGLAEDTGTKALVQTMAVSPVASLIREAFSSVAEMLSPSMANVLSVLVLVNSSQFLRRHDSDDFSSPLTLTPDLWPTGATPRIVYEQS